MRGSDGRMNGRDGGTRVVREGGREGGMEAIRHITFPQCIKGTGLSVTHTVRMGRGGGDGEREREDDKEDRARQRGKRGGLGFFILPFVSFSFPLFHPPISGVIQVTYSSQRGSFPPLLLLSSCLSLLLPPSLPFSFSPCSADSLNA